MARLSSARSCCATSNGRSPAPRFCYGAAAATAARHRASSRLSRSLRTVTVDTPEGVGEVGNPDEATLEDDVTNAVLAQLRGHDCWGELVRAVIVGHDSQPPDSFR